jgi:hypothetical protein
MRPSLSVLVVVVVVVVVVVHSLLGNRKLLLPFLVVK